MHHHATGVPNVQHRGGPVESVEERLGNDLNRVTVSVTTSRNALLLTATNGRAWLGDAALKALFPHGLDKLLKVGNGKLLLHLKAEG